jgi:2-polyprenyl-3-methyl-5-hydroxy-6-metoxy-1,4-benzoquinol methylase
VKIFDALIAPVLAARRSLRAVRPPHFAPLGALARGCAPLADLPRERIDAINQHSDEYFDNRALHAFWTGKPMSDPLFGPDTLWRFGLLLSALQVGPHDRVLDFGCGTGWTSVMLARTGADVTGSDISERALQIARSGAAAALTAEQAARLRFQRFDGHAIDAPDGYFDFVIFFDAFHHLPNPAAVLRECSRVLDPLGYLGFAEPGHGHAHSYTSADEMAHGILENEVDPEQLLEAGRAAGFAELELIVPPPGLVTLPMRRARWFLRGMPLIVPQDYVRAAILARPIGFLRKGPYTSTTLHPHALLATINPSRERVVARPGEMVAIAATIRNDAGTVWLKSGRRDRGYVRLGARIVRQSDSRVVDEWPRVELPNDMAHTTSCALTIEGRAPAEPGEYVARLDMVDEGIAWFSERGSKPADVRLLVES